MNKLFSLKEASNSVRLFTVVYPVRRELHSVCYHTKQKLLKTEGLHYKVTTF